MSTGRSRADRALPALLVPAWLVALSAGCGTSTPEPPVTTDTGAVECTTAADCTGEAPGACGVWTCDAAVGRCEPAAAPDGAPCDDGDACTTEACRDGQCEPEALVSTPEASLRARRIRQSKSTQIAALIELLKPK